MANGFGKPYLGSLETFINISVYYDRDAEHKKKKL